MRDTTDNSTRDAFDTPGRLSLGLVGEVRKAFGMTQADTAKLLSLHPMTISKLERGQLRLDNELRRKLLILIDIARLPGVPELVRYVCKTRTGTDAFFVAQAVFQVAA